MYLVITREKFDTNCQVRKFGDRADALAHMSKEIKRGKECELSKRIKTNQEISVIVTVEGDEGDD